MSDLAGLRAIVAGAGAFGSAIAFTLAKAGAKVILTDPKPLAQNASGIAAGMLAPAFESALDPASAPHGRLLAQARDLWPAFAERLEATGLERCGALLKAPAIEIAQIGDRLRAAGLKHEQVGETLFTPEDWRLEPRVALAAMRRGLLAHQGETRLGAVEVATQRSIVLTDGEIIEADAVILACGFGGLDLSPELSVLTPIKGQLLRFPDAGLSDGPILRSLLGYVVPSREGAVAGATMEEGRTDVSLSRDALDRLKVDAGWLAPGLGLARSNGFAGIRAATPDALPLLGRTEDGLYVATGARRNGWLFAPLAAAVLTRAIAGQPAAEDGRFAPGRFSRY